MEKKPKAWVDWTTTEIRILTDAWNSGRPIRAFMHLLPRHSLRAALVKGRLIGLPVREGVVRCESANKTAMREAVKASAHHALSLSEKVGVSRRTAQSFLKEMHEYGVIHISGWRKLERNGPPLAMYAWGKGEDVAMPKPLALRDRFRKRSLSKAGADPFKQLVDYSRALHQEAA